MVKLSGAITEINGRVGGTIWRYDICGQHAQADGRYVPAPASLAQRLQRRAFSICHRYIPSHATWEFVWAWQCYANQHPRKNKKGQMISLAWHCAFSSHNIPRVLKDLPIDEFPPVN